MYAYINLLAFDILLCFNSNYKLIFLGFKGHLYSLANFPNEFAGSCSGNNLYSFLTSGGVSSNMS